MPQMSSVRHGAKEFFFHPQKRVKTWVNKTLNVGKRPLAESRLDSETNLIVQIKDCRDFNGFFVKFWGGTCLTSRLFLPSSVILFVMHKNDIVQ